ncbi:glutathione S-transferase U18-like [Phoenix dactylifera]|uniref:glutathione transferase n=1 Tax=Phoenix dactylifera TaxID=42345 RepID=A0A8B9A6F1_PHODC|nr:glutathione S-transferase U18-like [Phoenix dactylifera]
MAATGGDVKLLGFWASPFVMRVKIALNLKSEGYESLDEVLGTKSELLLKSNPVYKMIPVLIHEGKPICESMVIVEYVDEVWAGPGPSIVPSDPTDRAVARFWATYIDDKLPSAVRTIIGVLKGNKAEAVEQIAAMLPLLEEAFKIYSKGKDFFGGDTIGYLDIALGSCLGWIRAVEKIVGVKLLDEEVVPLLVGWSKRFCVDGAVISVMPKADDLVEFSKAL